MKGSLRLLRVAATVGIGTLLGLSAVVPETMAQRGGHDRGGGRGGAASSPSFSPRGGGGLAGPRVGGYVRVPSARIVSPSIGRTYRVPSGSIAPPRSGRITSPSITSRRMSTERGELAPFGQRVHISPSPRGLRMMPGPTSRGATLPRGSTPSPASRIAPSNLALSNSGLRQNPGYPKPPNVKFDPRQKADRTGWQHRYRPFYYKHDRHRWLRRYYAYPVGGLWYWYWYDALADTDPFGELYGDAMLANCDPGTDACSEPALQALIAPAILEGRATPEDISRCQGEYRSFNAATGTFVTHGGDTRICPYLM